MLTLNRKTIGIFGGSFDPPHKGHIEISKIGLKKIKLKKIYWVITKKNPFKKKPFFSLKQRISSAQSEYDSLKDQIPNLEEKLLRTKVVAPRDGIVNRVLITTSGGVVQPGNPIVEMIPLDDELILEVEVAPTDIAYVIKDQKAIVQLSAFDFNVYGSLEGVVLNVSADTIKKDDGSTWYICLVSIPSDGVTTMARKLEILPGMQATVNIVSGSKTILQYLLQPFTNIKSKAFRER